jgi:hypothetical protein
MTGYMIPISFTLVYLPKLTAVRNFQPRSDYLYGGSSMIIQINNIPESLTCSNLSFFLLSTAQCTSVRYDLQAIGSATVTILIPPISEPVSILPTMSIRGYSETYAFPDSFQYIEPPRPTIQTIFPKVVPCRKSTLVYVNVSYLPILFDVSEIFVSLNSTARSQSLMVLDHQQSASSSDSPAVFNLFFKINTPTFETADVYNLLIFNKIYPDYFAHFPLRFIDPSFPLLESLVAIDTGAKSMGSSPLSVGSTSEHAIAILISNVPAGTAETDLTIQGQFNATLEYTLFSSASVTIVITVDSDEEKGTKHGMVGFSPSAPASCNVSCCSDSSCGEGAKCGVDYKYTCFTLNFFYDMQIEVLSIDNTQG